MKQLCKITVTVQSMALIYSETLTVHKIKTKTKTSATRLRPRPQLARPRPRPRPNSIGLRPILQQDQSLRSHHCIQCCLFVNIVYRTMLSKPTVSTTKCLRRLSKTTHCWELTVKRCAPTWTSTG